MKRLGVVLLAFATLLVLFWVGLGLFIRSGGFRQWLERRLGDSLRVDGRLEPLTWDGATLRSAGYTATGRPGSRVGSLRLGPLTAHLDWARVFAGQIVFDVVNVERAELDVVPATAPRQPVVPAAPKLVSWPGGLRLHFGVDQVNVANFSVLYHSRRGRIHRLSDFRVVVTKTGPEAWAFAVNGGAVRPDGFPEIRVLKAQANLTGQRLALAPAELALVDGGTAAVHGEVGLAGDRQADLHVSAVGVRLADLPTRGEPLDGTADGEFDYRGSLNRAEHGTLEGDIRAHGVRYDFSRYLGRLRLLARSGLIGEGSLDSASAHVRYDYRHWRFTAIEAAYRDAVRITGAVEVTGKELQGQLQVGCRPGFLDWIPGAMQAVFTEERDGLRWTPVQLSGTVDDPKEDLTKRLLDSLGERFGRDLKKDLKDVGKSLRDLWKH